MNSSVYYLFFHDQEVVEVRGLGLSGNNPAWEGWAGPGAIVSGYFNNAEDFAEAAEVLEKSGASGVYFTLNPCRPELIARAHNRLVVAGKGRPLTSDKDIQSVRWLPIDVDPKRAAGISSSNDELSKSREVTSSIIAWLNKSMGFPNHIVALSGNGYHLLYRLPDIDLSIGPSGNQGLVASALRALNDKFGTHDVAIDLSVFNPARIWKLYGTTARKGDHTADRPHRKSILYDKNPTCLDEVPVLSLELLESLAKLAPTDRPVSVPLTGPTHFQKRSREISESSDPGVLDVQAYLDHYGIPVKCQKSKHDAVFYVLDQCVFDSNHQGGEAAIVASPHPPYLTYQCFHDSCRNRTWKEARAIISGNDSLSGFLSNFRSRRGQKNMENQKLLESTEWEPERLGNADDPKTLPRVPKPQEIDPAEFFIKRGKRDVFSVALMTKYLSILLHPICHTDGVLWKYANGLWKPFAANRLNKLVNRALKDRIQTAWYKSAREDLAAATNREEEEWPRFEGLVNLANGLYDLESHSFRPHHPRYGCRTQVITVYHPDAQCPRWKQFVDEIFQCDTQKVTLLQEYMGYLLMPTCRFEKALFMYGTGANGKSTVIKVIELILGLRNVSHLTLEDLSNRFQIVALKGKMVNLAPEVESDNQAGTEVLKMAVSGDTLEGDQKYGTRVTFQSHVKFIFAMNSPPRISDKAHGFSRKVIVLDFSRRFAPEEMDLDLLKKLEAEKEGILTWMVAGAERLMHNGGFSIGEDIQRTTHNFMASMNPVLTFMEERCIQGSKEKVPATELFQAYKVWCAESAHKPMGKSRFYEQIMTHCSLVKDKQRIEINGARPWGFIGIGLIP